MPDTDKLKIELLKVLYNSHKKDPFGVYQTDSLIEETQDQLGEDVDGSSFDYVVNRLDEQFLVDYDPALNSRGTIQLMPLGVENLQREVGDTFLEDDKRFRILSELEELERENPGGSWEGESFRSDIPLSSNVVDLNLWYLIRKGWVDATWVIGDPPYTALQISPLGRQGLQEYRSRGEGDTSAETEFEEQFDIIDIIHQEESATLEFKETFLFDVYQEQPNSELKEEVAKEVCALANSEGGKVIIGVRDEDREVLGLERDLNLMAQGKDDFERQVNQIISTKIGDPFASLFTRIQFENVDEAEVCVILVEAAPEPVYCDGVFIVRNGSSSIPLDTPDAVDYIDQHWSG